MNFFVSSTIWLPVTTSAETSLNVTPETFRNSSARRFTAPPLQCPQPLQCPVHETFAESTGCVRL